MEIIVLLVAGGAAYFWWRQQKSSARNSQRSPSPHSAPPPTSNSRADPGTNRVSVTVSYSGKSNRPRLGKSERLSKDFQRYWVRSGQSIAFGGHALDCGLLYVGKGLAASNGYQIEPALIDPKLHIDTRNPAHDGAGMGYWPSYKDISPQHRAAYLKWLADGRKAPRAYIGYVFLYFYGLERRILHDHERGAGDRDERNAIFKEVQRLLRLYGDNRSFARYAQQFLTTIILTTGNVDVTRRPPIIFPGSNDFSDLLKVGLGQFAAQGKPIPPTWAAAWVLHDPEIRLRTPARRCENEFKELFKILYSERHGDGLTVKPNKTQLTPTYRPASSGFRGDVSAYRGPPLPDITALKRPRSMLADLAERACDKLDAYSRFVGKDAAEQDSLHGVALLPPELAGRTEHSGLKALQEELEPEFKEDDSATISTALLLKHFPIEKNDRFAKKEAVLLSQLLEKLELGIEPDVRFCGFKPDPRGTVVVYRQGAHAPSAPSQAYESAALLMRLSAMVSAADGDVSPEERAQLQQHVEASMALEPNERTRLRAHTQWLLSQDLGTSGLKSKLEDLPSAQRELVAEHLVSVAAADGHIDPGEIKILQKLYKLLGLDADRVMSDLHGASSAPADDRRTRSGERPPAPSPGATGSASDETGRSALDQNVLQRRLEETARVSNLLRDVFAEDEEEAPEQSETPTDQDAEPAAIAGLDTHHSAFLKELGTGTTWERNDLQALADRFGLMLEGALDRINEAAFEQCDAPCIEEEDDSYIVDHEVYEEMTA